MNYRITAFQIKILTWIVDRIIKYYSILIDAVRKQFSEDNKPSLDSFLTECHENALEINEERRLYSFHDKIKYVQLRPNDIIKAGAMHSIDFGLMMPIFNEETIGQTPSEFSKERTFFNRVYE